MRKNTKSLSATNVVKANHPDRLTNVGVHNGSPKKRVNRITEEAKSKGYTILNCITDDDSTQAIVLFKEINGVELAYNISWEKSKFMLLSI